MILETGTPSPGPADPRRVQLESATALECDQCGKTVRRELTVQHVRDDGEIVVLCAECESGAD